MAKVYANLILKGIKTLEDVPDHLKDDVRALLEMEPAEKEKNGTEGV